MLVSMPQSPKSKELKKGKKRKNIIRVIKSGLFDGKLQQEMCLNGNGSQRQWPSLTEREWPLHPFPLQLPLAAVAAAVN